VEVPRGRGHHGVVRWEALHFGRRRDEFRGAEGVPELPEIVQAARVHGAVFPDEHGVRASRGRRDRVHGEFDHLKPRAGQTERVVARTAWAVAETSKVAVPGGNRPRGVRFVHPSHRPRQRRDPRRRGGGPGARARPRERPARGVRARARGPHRTRGKAAAGRTRGCVTSRWISEESGSTHVQAWQVQRDDGKVGAAHLTKTLFVA
jgi:hypothetical protein